MQRKKVYIVIKGEGRSFWPVYRWENFPAVMLQHYQTYGEKPKPFPSGPGHHGSELLFTFEGPDAEEAREHIEKVATTSLEEAREHAAAGRARTVGEVAFSQILPGGGLSVRHNTRISAYRPPNAARVRGKSMGLFEPPWGSYNGGVS